MLTHLIVDAYFETPSDIEEIKDLSDNTLNGVLIQKIEAEILEVLKKYMDIREENIDIEVSHEDGKEILGLNIILEFHPLNNFFLNQMQQKSLQIFLLVIFPE